MAKYCGNIGYSKSVESAPGVWTPAWTIRKIFGDIVKDNRNLTSKPEHVNDDISVSMRISFIADPYARQNFHQIKYVEYMGSKWKVTTVEVAFPRLILVLGGEYNAE